VCFTQSLWREKRGVLYSKPVERKRGVLYSKPVERVSEPQLHKNCNAHTGNGQKNLSHNVPCWPGLGLSSIHEGIAVSAFLFQFYQMSPKRRQCFLVHNSRGPRYSSNFPAQ